nr:pyridoxal-5-phosphate-dependent protein subunit beta [bacterium]
KKICKSDAIDQLDVMGISGIGNLLSAIKTAKFYEMTSDDVIFTVATDSMELYDSRMVEYKQKYGKYSELQAGRDFDGCILSQSIDYMKDLNYYDRKNIHNLKYFTWIEQQAKELEDLNQLWYDREILPKLFNQINEWDELINEFNKATGVLKNL